MTIAEYNFQANKNVFMCKKKQKIKKNIFLRSKASKPRSYFVRRYLVSSPSLAYALVKTNFVK